MSAAEEEEEEEEEEESHSGMSGDAKKAKESISYAGSKLRPILSLELTEEIPLHPVYVGILKDKRNTSKAIQLISTASVGFGHLKRCNGFRLLLAPVNETSQEELKSSLSSRGFDLSLLEDEFEVLKIPSKPVRTKSQSELCCKIWPVNFHPDPKTESIISGDIFTPEKLRQMESLMRSTIQAASLESVGNSECNGSALVVDPESGQPLAIAASKIDEHPLWHAAMLAIDLVAKIQGGGAWDLVANDEKLDLIKKDKSKRKFVGFKPLCYPSSLNGIINFPEAEPLMKKSTKSKQKMNKIEGDAIAAGEIAKTGPYLCTNFWIFLYQEPCALCAMALLHSRASKIFYGVKTNGGYLESKAMLHTTPGLNHRYQVWSGILENECEAVRGDIINRELKL